LNNIAHSGRDKRIDFFRGLALLTIYIDHVHPNFLASLTLKRFAFLDAADVFVFISGYVIGMVYTRELWRRGLKACFGKALQRCSQIYRWHLTITAGTFLVLYCFARNGHYLPDSDLYTFFRAPISTCLLTITLLHSPDYLNILPLYLILTAFAPVAVYFVDKRNRTFLACSAAVYLAVQFIPGLTLQPHPGSLLHTLPVFNPLAWQFLFVFGILLGNLRQRGHKWPGISRRWAVSVAAVALLLIACVCFSATSRWLEAVLQTDFWRVHLAGILSFNNKARLGPLRLLNLVILLVLIHPWRGTNRFWNNWLTRAITRCGQNPLAVFGSGVLLSYTATLLLSEHSSILMQVYVNIIGCTALIAVAVSAFDLKEHGSALYRVQRATRRLVWLSGVGQAGGQ
jgi:hypothetical protein